MVNAWHTKDHYISKLIPIAAALAIMAGCASPAKKACLKTDWQRVGFVEASQGKPSADSASQRDTCIREGVTPDMARYELGRRQGLEKYCTAENGFAVGSKGAPAQEVCPPELRAAFEQAYGKGLMAYAQQLEEGIDAKADLLKKMLKERAGVEEEIAFLEQEIAAAREGQMRLRMGMISEMRMLESNQESLRLQTEVLEMDLKKMRQELPRIKSRAGSLTQ